MKIPSSTTDVSKQVKLTFLWKRLSFLLQLDNGGSRKFRLDAEGK